MHQGSVLNLLLFAVVMDGVTSVERSGILSDDLVLVAPIMEQLSRRVTERRVILLHKEQKMNAGKSRVMIGRSDGNIIVNSRK